MVFSSARLRKTDGQGVYADYADAGGGSIIWAEAGSYRLRITIQGTSIYAESGTAVVAAAVTSGGALAAPVLTKTSAAWVNPIGYDYLYPNAQLGDYVQQRLSATATFANPRYEYQRLVDTNTGPGVVEWASMAHMAAGEVHVGERLRRKASPGSGLVAGGDSITEAGYWMFNFRDNNPCVPFATWNRVSAGGRRVTGNSDYNNLADHEDEIVALNPAIYSVLIGANQLIAYTETTNPGIAHAQAAALFLVDLYAHLDRIRARVPGVRIIVCTLLPRTDPMSEAHNLRRGYVNADLRLKVGSKFDALADFAADPDIGPDSAPDGGVYWDSGDRLHPNGAGHDLMRAIWEPVARAQAAIADAWTQTSAWSSDDVSDTIGPPAALALTFDPAVSASGHQYFDEFHTVIGVTDGAPTSLAMAAQTRAVAPCDVFIVASYDAGASAFALFLGGADQDASDKDNSGPKHVYMYFTPTDDGGVYVVTPLGDGGSVPLNIDSGIALPSTYKAVRLTITGNGSGGFAGTYTVYQGTKRSNPMVLPAGLLATGPIRPAMIVGNGDTGTWRPATIKPSGVDDFA